MLERPSIIISRIKNKKLREIARASNPLEKEKYNRIINNLQYIARMFRDGQYLEVIKVSHLTAVNSCQ